MNNGLHVFGRAVSLDIGPIGPTDKVTWAFQIMNSGQPLSDQNYTTAASTAASAQCQSANGSDWGCVAVKLGAVMVGWIFANCDGPLAADTVTMTGAQLYSLTGSSLSHPYLWSKTYDGVDSPTGCGSNSIYRVDVIVERP